MARSYTTDGPWSSFARAPLARSVIFMAMGCALVGLFKPPLLVTAIIAAMALIIFLYFVLRSTTYSTRWKRGVGFSVWMFAFGMLWATLRHPGTSPQNIIHHVGNEGPWIVRLQAINRLAETQLRADAEVIGRHDGENWENSNGTIMLTALRQPGDPPMKVGDRLLIRAPMKKIQRVADPGGFDRQVWAAARGIELELFATRQQYHPFDHRRTWIDPFAIMRSRISSWVEDAGLERSSQALVKALVLGQRDELDSEQKTAFARSGTVHILAVSGMHVGIIYMILSVPFQFFGERRNVRIIRGVAVLAGLWAYAGITGGAPSIVRATIMFSMLTVADMFRYRTDGLNTLAAAMFLLLLFDPSNLWNIGFQLSFLAVLGIVVIYRPLLSLWSPRWKFLRLLWSLAAVSIAAQAFTTPVSIYYFKAFPLLFLPANLIVVSAVSIAVYLAVAMLFLQMIPAVVAPIKWWLQLILEAIARTTSWFASFPDAYPSLRIDLAMCIIFYVLIISIIGYWYWKWRSLAHAFQLSFLLMLLLWGNTALRTNTSNTLTLYDERNGIMASIAQGRRMSIMMTPDKDLQSNYTSKKIEQHRNARGIKEVEVIPWHGSKPIHMGQLTVSAAGRWKSEHFDLLFIDDPSFAIRDLRSKLDAVVIHDMPKVPEGLLESAAAVSDRIVLAGKNSWRTREHVAHWCMERNILFHDIFAQGAFVLQR